MPYLVWDSPRGRVVHEIQRAVSVIGRDAVSDLVIDDASVSGRHALLQLQEGLRVQITDLGSENGTRINGASLTPEMPSTIEAGDFLNFGRVFVTFHAIAPPQGAAPPPAPVREPHHARDVVQRKAKASPRVRTPAKPAKKREERPVPPPPPQPAMPSETSPVWKYAALGLAAVLVAAVAAVLAMQMDAEQTVQVVRHDGNGESQPATPPAPDPEPVEPMPEPREAEPRDPPTEPDATGPVTAGVGELPPQVFASIELCPDLVEIDGGRYYPVRLQDWDRREVKAIGADGRLYRFDGAQVSKIIDRADLERRATARSRGLEADDVEGRLELARWCRNRFAHSVARALAREVLDLRPDQSEAKSLLLEIGDA